MESFAILHKSNTPNENQTKELQGAEYKKAFCALLFSLTPNSTENVIWRRTRVMKHIRFVNSPVSQEEVTN